MLSSSARRDGWPTSSLPFKLEDPGINGDQSFGAVAVRPDRWRGASRLPLATWITDQSMGTTRDFNYESGRERAETPTPPRPPFHDADLRIGVAPPRPGGADSVRGGSPSSRFRSLLRCHRTTSSCLIRRRSPESARQPANRALD